MALRGRERVGGILRNPNEKVKRRAEHQVQLPRRGVGSMERLAKEESDEDTAVMEQLIRKAVEPKGRVAGPQKDSDDPIKRGN